MSTGGSRWGITGNTEVSDGLSAVYKFETRLGDGAASQSTNQLYVGLSGGFGNLTMGKFHNAAYHSGGMRDTGYWFGGSDTSTKVGNTLSYAFTTDVASFQADAIMDGRNTGQSVDEFQLGISLSLGDIGKIGFGYENVEDTIKMGMAAEVPKVKEPMDEEPMDEEPMDEEPMMVQKTNEKAVELGGTIYESGKAKVFNYVYTVPVGSTGAGTVFTQEVYEAPADFSRFAPDALTTDYSFEDVGDIKAADIENAVDGDDVEGVTVTRKPAEKSIKLGTGTAVLTDKSEINEVTITFATKAGTTPPSIKLYEVEKGKKYFATAGDNSELVLTSASSYDTTTRPQISDDNVMLVAVYDENAAPEEEEEEQQVVEEEEEEETPDPTPPMTATTEVDTHSYTRTGVSSSFDLGGVTLGLGYSEKESNKKDSLDEKTTYVGLSGSVGDTGLSWRSQFRDVTNSGNAKGDRNPWMVGIHKSLGGGAFVFMEHQNADKGVSGDTVIALGVNF